MIKTNIKQILVFASLLVIFVYASYDGLSDRYLWFDESGQFFISQGLNHYSEPYSPKGTIKDVIDNNSQYNLDPGGFSILLRFWSYISCNVLFLRLLPYSFYLIASIFLYKIARIYLKNRELSIIYLSLWFILPVISHQATELRAYTMEMTGTIISTWFCIVYKDKLSYLRLFLLGGILGFFCTSRYCFVIVALAVSLRITFLVFKNRKDYKEFFIKIMVFSLPLVVSIGSIVLFSLSKQNSGFQLSYAGYINKQPVLMLNVMSLAFYAVIVLAILKWIKLKSLSEMHILTLMIGFLVFLMSIIGKFPWDYFRSISATMLIMLFLILYVMKYIEQKCETICNCNFIYIAYFLCAVVLVLSGYHVRKNPETNYLKEFCEWRENNDTVKVSVDPRIGCDIKYLFEYGCLMDKCKEWNYPDAFDFYMNENEIKSQYIFSQNSLNVYGGGYLIMKPYHSIYMINE